MSEDNLKLNTEPNDLVIRGEDGDPLPQGTRMIEKESYERVIDGTRIAAEACARLARMESEHFIYWNTFRGNLDNVRRIAMSISGLPSAPFKETGEFMQSDVGAWRTARDRFHEGIKQAAGGARQMATCHRSDLSWSRIASSLEQMRDKLGAITRGTVKKARASGKLWMPDRGWVQ